MKIFRTLLTRKFLKFSRSTVIQSLFPLLFQRKQALNLECHAWAQFLKENKAQTSDETKRLGKEWDIIKNAEDKTEFNKYQAMADAYNKEHNVEASSSTSGNTQKEVEAWLQANIKRVQAEGTHKELWDRLFLRVRNLLLNLIIIWHILQMN